jgi:hypothetical protein
MTPRRQPHIELAMAVKENPAFPHHEDRDRKMPARMHFFHEVNYKEVSFGYGVKKASTPRDRFLKAYYRQKSKL